MVSRAPIESNLLGTEITAEPIPRVPRCESCGLPCTREVLDTKPVTYGTWQCLSCGWLKGRPLLPPVL